MCGIVGYAGGWSALEVVLAGLNVLGRKHTAYDSAGVAVVADGGLAMAKKAGKLPNLHRQLAQRPLPTGTTALGHTRQATHGGPTDSNAHPHLDDSGRVAVVHNGSIDNFAALRTELSRRSHQLDSDTDTEVVAHLLAESFSSCGDLAEAMRQVCPRLEGSFALAAVHADEPDVVVGAHCDAPLFVGIGQGESFLASDTAAFTEHTREAIELGRNQVVVLRREAVTVTDFEGDPVEVRTFRVEREAAAEPADRGGALL